MLPRRVVLVVAATVLAASGGCEGLPGGTPTSLPTELPGIELPTVLPTADGGAEGTAAPPAATGEPTEGEAAPAPTGPADPATDAATDAATEPGTDAATDLATDLATDAATEPVPTGTGEPGVVDDVLEDVPWWVWLLLALAVVGLVAAAVALRRAKQSELRWAALWHELTGEARWLDERVVPAVQDRSLDPTTLVTRWQDGQRRFDDLDRRVWAAANEERRVTRANDLNALSEALLRLRDAVDTEVSLRATGVEQPGLPDAAQTIADARDELRRTVNARTR